MKPFALTTTWHDKCPLQCVNSGGRVYLWCSDHHVLVELPAVADKKAVQSTFLDPDTGAFTPFPYKEERI